jgi:hypothetical protein
MGIVLLSSRPSFDALKKERLKEKAEENVGVMSKHQIVKQQFFGLFVWLVGLFNFLLNVDIKFNVNT